MKCDQCAKETTEGVSQEWIGVSVISTSTYGAPSGPSTVSETTWGNFIPIPTFLCAACYEPRAKKARRNVRVSALLGLVGIGLLVLAYILLRNVFDVPAPDISAGRQIGGALAALVGFLLVKFAWSELNMRGELLRETGTRMELHDVLHPYAHRKAKEIGCAQVWDLYTFKSISLSNERAKELDRLYYLLDKGIITEDEYEEKKKQIYEG